jgi:hypothetical protein
MLPLPMHRAKLPLRTGFHCACKTGFECWKTQRSRGTNGSDDAGKSYKWTTVGQFSIVIMSSQVQRNKCLGKPNRTSSNVPVLFHSSWTAPDFGFGFVGSVRCKLIVCGPCSRSSSWRALCQHYNPMDATIMYLAQDRNPRPCVVSSQFDGSRHSVYKDWASSTLFDPSTHSARWYLTWQLECCSGRPSQAIEYMDLKKLGDDGVHGGQTYLIVPSCHSKEHSSRMPSCITNAKSWIWLRWKSPLHIPG